MAGRWKYKNRNVIGKRPLKSAVAGRKSVIKHTKNKSDFFEKEGPANPQKAEYLLPTLNGGLLKDEKCTVKVLETTNNWFGVTYKKDKAAVVESFRKLIVDGVYREELYSDL